jgi:hypothetical protein
MDGLVLPKFRLAKGVRPTDIKRFRVCVCGGGGEERR